ncbi:hypothetical protein [Maioricimonas sp. JC845]|uniref:hypothetical protein n=1 Tax=Maioricimonas sp. JC845 TaxID=3232138 RepID=UPI003457ED8B
MLHPRTIMPMVLLAFVALCLVAGCSTGQSDAVTVYLDGLEHDDYERRQQILRHFEQAFDGRAVDMSHINDRMSVRVSPVADVHEVTAIIDFGEVTSVNGRVVTVDVTESE